MNSLASYTSPAYVLEDQTPENVARAIIESGEQKQSFYIFDMDEAKRRVSWFQKKMPRVQIFYAMKSNDTDMMLKLMASLGLSFDCASTGEIYKVRKLGVNPKKIIYAVPFKSPSEMKYARNAGVQYTTFDSSCELKKLRESWPDARLLIRIRIESLSKRDLGIKFGCDFETEAIGLLDQARPASLGLNVVGVAFHVGSICFSPESYVVGLRMARALFDHEARNGRKMDLVDIGGGFLSHRTDAINEVSFLINEALKELFPEPSVRVIAEPGRYLCDSAFKMYSNIVGVRTIIQNQVRVNMLYLNNGAHGSMRHDESWHKIRKFQRSPTIEPIQDEEVILWGPTCNPTDRVLSDQKVKLPRCMPHDWLVIDIHGAYTLVFATQFSSLGSPLVRTVVSKDLWNHIKQSQMFRPTDFVLNPDISTPLPSTLPPLLPAFEDSY